ncbi:carbohydrate-binding family 9-like protein [Paenibacillus sp. LHD-117]|uniref:carbohydrate-binding family 9-like protein n=1 Tax=Paenibacillus sp. LHD-117 TaxID=3071412 RepID=UPI0027E0BC45|nr:carbohydrate-binding family 9-like protein [Paenibacillus sp. LHD-117]MDQ6421529.1 carbohydrate-binding family 9-like protein [Paenibacillus sp. LHD-117]
MSSGNQELPKRYVCKPAVRISGNGPTGDEAWQSVDWSRCEAVSLFDTVTGEAVREPTEVRACWHSDYVFIQFRCTDRHIVSRFEEHDDPLYEQDVVEVFIDDRAEGGVSYVELEVSPRNVVFDARIWNDGSGHVTGRDIAWNMEGLRTEVLEGEHMLMYLLAVPTAHFSRKPEPGASWLVNFYRIDENAEGIREFQAWSPTGAINFHMPSRFGELIFEDHESIDE